MRALTCFPPPRKGRRFHVYVSIHNFGAAALMQELAEHAAARLNKEADAPARSPRSPLSPLSPRAARTAARVCISDRVDELWVRASACWSI